jgi:hypothetical protein
MRRDGDLLIEHMRGAQSSVLLCAPFIKTTVLKALLDCVSDGVSVRIVTRWIPEEIAAGVSDLGVFDLVQAREKCSLQLLNNLHAKVYLADDDVLVGSANLTGRALGWSSSPNVEILTRVSASDNSVGRCLAALENARPATKEEMERIRQLVDAMQSPPLPEGAEADGAIARPWLPTLGAPSRLFEAYVPQARGRLTQPIVDAADVDLKALDIRTGLSQDEFKEAVKVGLRTMTATKRILEAARSDLSDAAGADLVKELSSSDDMSPQVQWAIVREWITYFLGAEFEIAPQSFIVRQRS